MVKLRAISHKAYRSRLLFCSYFELKAFIGAFNLFFSLLAGSYIVLSSNRSWEVGAYRLNSLLIILRAHLLLWSQILTLFSPVLHLENIFRKIRSHLLITDTQLNILHKVAVGHTRGHKNVLINQSSNTVNGFYSRGLCYILESAYPPCEK